MEITKCIIGNLNGKEIIEYNMKNKNGIEVSILNLGGIITKIMTPDRNGDLENIVLTYKNKEDYFTNPSYYGALIGRTSGRIGKGKAILNDVELNFNLNYGENSGHGGEIGFDKKIWDVESVILENECRLKLRYLSVDGEEGYPGNVDTIVSYTLNNNNELNLLIEAASDKDTLFNVTNHSYFNLSGNYKRDITSSTLMMNCDKYLEIDGSCAVTGRAIDVKNTPFEFRAKKYISSDINKEDIQLKLGNGYDHPFIFNNEIGIITLEEIESGRGLKVETNQPAVVIYTTNYPGEELLTNGEKPEFRAAICLETQAPPIASSGMFIEKSILRKNEKYSKETKYKFYVI